MTTRARRSLKASPEGINRANNAVLVFATKMDLAVELEISRATVQNFFARKPVKRENFHKICQKLELPWREIAELPPDMEIEEHHNGTHSLSDIDALVLEVRQRGHVSIQQRCGMIRVLDMSQPIDLNDIYTNVNTLEKISGRRRLEVTALLKVCVSDEFERPSLGRIDQEQANGLETVKNYSKLMVLGKPGAGKTTFLKHIAIQCSLGTLLANRVPIFISLKDFAETEPRLSLLEYIASQFDTYGVSNPVVLLEILNHGRALVLLDGLDEVRESDCYWLLHEIRSFTGKFHDNHFVITCRIATREYTLEEFTEVEVADFDQVQIASFATKWFAAIDPIKGNRFIHKLQQNPPIQELATNPLLLTLLCLIVEESADFPSNRSDIYKEGLNVLLRKWDAKRNIAREQVYKHLSIQHKEDLLSKIALLTFKRGNYFFRQQELEQHIVDYICNLPGVSTQIEALQLDSEAVLKSIEAQHGLLVERARGIYSFSHLTFHEYFAAREIVSSSDPQALKIALSQLVSCITENRWREVFLLSVGMLRNADYLLQLMKQQIDKLVACDQQLQAFLTWVSQKSRSTETNPHKLATVRAFYFDLDLARELDMLGGTFELARAINGTFTRALALDFDLALDLALDRTLALNRVLDLAHNRILALNRVLGRAISRAHDVDPELERALQQLKEQISYPEDQNGKEFVEWWKAKCLDWTEQFRAVMIKYRNIGYDWQFSDQQKDVLKKYYDANRLLVDCLNSNCYVTSTVRQEIEETLLVPSKLEVTVKAGSALTMP